MPEESAIEHAVPTPKIEQTPPHEPEKPMFSAVDPLLAEIQSQLKLKPELVSTLSELCSTPIDSVKHDVLSVRSEDLVTFLHHFASGRLPTRYEGPGNAIMEKTEGWYFMTPIYANSFFQDHPDLISKDYRTNSKTIHEQIRDNNNIYRNITLSTAFVRNIVPHLDDGWFATAKKTLLEHSVRLDEESLEGQFMEAWIDNLIEEISELNTNSRSLEKFRKNPQESQQPYLCALYEMTRDKNLFPVLHSYLSDAEETRHGILVAFNKNVLQERYVTSANDTQGITDSDPEVVVFSPDGIDLSQNPIQAIIPLGEYEDSILQTLGIAA